MKLLRKIFFGLVYMLPAVLFFSYYPLLSLGRNATMNFELSLPLIWLVIFDIVSFVVLIKQGTKPLRGLSDRRFFLLALFPLYCVLSIFWSTNPLRAILTAGIIVLLFFAIFAIVSLLPLLQPSVHFRRNILRAIFIPTLIISAFCWLQCLLDVFGVTRSVTLLCRGCTSWTFGFPHPSGFAIEPQFMGNLLLAPTLLALYLLIFPQHQPKKSQKPQNAQTTSASKGATTKAQTRWLLLISFFLSATLFLTMSRGAIYAYAVALCVMIIFALVRHHFRPLLILIPCISFIVTLLAQGTFAAISPTSDTFVSGVTKVVHQLSLGIIDFRPQATDVGLSEDGEVSGGLANSAENLADGASGDATASTPDNSSSFDGYVPASTNVRLGLNDLAIRTWASRPNYIFFGSGLGGAGLALSATFADNYLAQPDAIVQNEFCSLLLELGLAGLLLAALGLLVAFGNPKFLRSRRQVDAMPSFWRHPALPLLVALIVAYLVTLNFFSGLPNALHIYLLPPLLYIALQK